MRSFNTIIWVINWLLAVFALEVLASVYPQLSGVKRVNDWVMEFSLALVIVIIYYSISMMLPGLRGCAGVFLGFASLGAALAVFTIGPEPYLVALALALPGLIILSLWQSWRNKRLKENEQDVLETETATAIDQTMSDLTS